MRPINEIIVHCTATRPEWWATRSLAQKIVEVRLWHTRDRGWKDIGYHYLIDRDGKTSAGRPLDQVGAHVAGRNTGTIGIALFGGHGSAATDKFETNFTPAQDVALRSLIADLQRRFGPVPVTGHNQYSAKACPGFHAPTWFAAGPTAAAPIPSTAPLAPPAREVPDGPSGFLALIFSRLFSFLNKGGPA
jgi:N-acetylmuramoyl-L-alanine amidase